MGVRILTGLDDGGRPTAALYCSTSMAAFGPLIDGATCDDAKERAERFLASLKMDARKIDDVDLMDAWVDFASRPS